MEELESSHDNGGTGVDNNILTLKNITRVFASKGHYRVAVNQLTLGMQKGEVCCMHVQYMYVHTYAIPNSHKLYYLTKLNKTKQKEGIGRYVHTYVCTLYVCNFN